MDTIGINETQIAVVFGDTYYWLHILQSLQVIAYSSAVQWVFVTVDFNQDISLPGLY